VRSLSDTISAISTLTRLAHKFRSNTETVTITDSVTRVPPGVQPKPPSRPTLSVLAQELRTLTTVTQHIHRFLFETVHVSDHVRIDVRQYSKIIRVNRVKKLVRILDLVKLADSVYNKRGN
jgi:hypothetical protein